MVENSKEDDVEVDVSVKESEKSEASMNRSLNDVWLFDLHLNEWKEINPSVKVQSSFNNKKLRKTFEPRMAHSTNLVGNYLVIFWWLQQSYQSVFAPQPQSFVARWMYRLHFAEILHDLDGAIKCDFSSSVVKSA